MKTQDYQARAQAVGTLFKSSDELCASLAKAQQTCAGEVKGTGGTNSSSHVLEQLAADPFALSKAYDDF